jgi:transcriptional regulator GlxA family with amidase domain
MSQRNVAILIFDDVEVLDFCGPFEVFAVTGRTQEVQPFNVYTVAETLAPVTTRGGMSVNPRYSIADCPPPDILVVPGGYGTRRAMHNPALIDWARAVAQRSELVTSVCTGSAVLGAAGLLDGLRATTHHSAFDLLRGAAPSAQVIEDARFIDNGRVITSAGISAGIDMALHVVARLLGEDTARETAHYMEYDWAGDGANGR